MINLYRKYSVVYQKISVDDKLRVKSGKLYILARGKREQIQGLKN